MQKQIIQTVSGHIGSGKSYHARHWLKAQIAENGGKPIPVTLATPTNELSEEHHREFTKLGIPSMVISQDHFRSAGEAYRKHGDAGYDGVLIDNITVALNTATNTANRLLIIDEVFTPFENIKIRFKSPEDVRELVVVPATDTYPDAAPMYEVIPHGAIKTVLKEFKDDEDGYKGYKPNAKKLAKFADNEHYRVVIDQKSWSEAACGNAFVERDEKGNILREKPVWLQFTVFMKASIVDAYKDTLIVSANFDETLLGLMWSKEAEFRRNDWIQPRLGYQDMKHVADGVELYHPPVKNLSKFFLTRLGKGDEEGGNQDYQDRVASCLGEMFPGREHIYCSNKLSETEDYRWNLEYGERVITNPFGWNKFKHCTMAVFLAAINFDPDTEERLYAFYGITRAQAKNALCYQIIYQFFGRTLIRDKKAIEESIRNGAPKVVLIAPDEDAAKAMQKMFGCPASTTLAVDFGAQPKRGRPKVEKSEDQKREERRLRKQKSRANQAAEKAAQLRREAAYDRLLAISISRPQGGEQRLRDFGSPA